MPMLTGAVVSLEQGERRPAQVHGVAAWLRTSCQVPS